MLSGQFRITVEPVRRADWWRAEPAERAMEKLIAMGFRHLGYYLIEPEIYLAGFLHDDEHILALIVDSQYECRIDVGCTDQSGDEWVASSAVDTGRRLPPYQHVQYMPQSEPQQQFDAIAVSCPKPKRKRFEGEFTDAVEAAHARLMNWRVNIGGYSVDELKSRIFNLSAHHNGVVNAPVDIEAIREAAEDLNHDVGYGVLDWVLNEYRDALNRVVPLSQFDWPPFCVITNLIDEYGLVRSVEGPGLDSDDWDFLLPLAKQLLKDFPPREAFERFINQCSDGEFQKILSITEPVEADVYLELLEAGLLPVHFYWFDHRNGQPLQAPIETYRANFTDADCNAIPKSAELTALVEKMQAAGFVDAGCYGDGDALRKGLVHPGHGVDVSIWMQQEGRVAIAVAWRNRLNKETCYTNWPEDAWPTDPMQKHIALPGEFAAAVFEEAMRNHPSATTPSMHVENYRSVIESRHVRHMNALVRRGGFAPADVRRRMLELGALYDPVFVSAGDDDAYCQTLCERLTSQLDDGLVRYLAETHVYGQNLRAIPCPVTMGTRLTVISPLSTLEFVLGSLPGHEPFMDMEGRNIHADVKRTGEKLFRSVGPVQTYAALLAESPYRDFVCRIKSVTEPFKADIYIDIRRLPETTDYEPRPLGRPIRFEIEHEASHEPPVTRAQIVAVEKAIGYTFPREYVKFMKDINGFTPQRIYDAPGGCTLEAFFPFGATNESPNSSRFHYRWLTRDNYVPSYLWPIGDHDNGTFLIGLHPLVYGIVYALPHTHDLYEYQSTMGDGVTLTAPFLNYLQARAFCASRLSEFIEGLKLSAIQYD